MPTALPNDVETQLDGLKAAGDQWAAKCPTHADNNPSLTVKVLDSGKILVHCHAGCDPLDVLAALGITSSSNEEWTPNGPATAVYDYRDDHNQLLFQVLRTADKGFSQRRVDPAAKSGWKWSLGDVRRVLYRLPELIDGLGKGRNVCIVEGEKDVETLRHYGHLATTNPGGAGKWRSEFAAYFIDASVTIIADKDKPGQAHARTIAADLTGIAAQVWVVEAADPHKDVTAHLQAGLTMSDVVVTHRPTEVVLPDLAPDIKTLLASGDVSYDWLVPDLLERGERFMLTGFEGLGKSMWLRMIAVCIAAGIHPTTFRPIAPLKVLYLDCENSLRQTRRAFRAMVDQASRSRRPLPDGGLRMILKPNGVNLPHSDDAAWLLERVTAHRPDVLVIGPLYRLHYDNPNDESTARKVVGALDAARNAVDCAVMIEAHAGHGEWGKNRSVRPTGSSLYLRWPEFGYGMRPDPAEVDSPKPQLVEVVPWRGPRDERAWPSMLQRSASGWPWEPYDGVMQRAAS